jgi:succinate dehydrogenase/fumarate reductase flavoprotein subunit
MQNDAAVFRTGETLQEGCQKIDETVASFGDVKVGWVPRIKAGFCCLRFVAAGQ